MVEILESSVTSNIIAALSLIVGFVGLVVTFRTMTSAKKIQEEMERMKINVLDRHRFLKYKEKTIEAIERQKISVEKAETISKKKCMSFSLLVSEAKGFKSIFKPDDYSEIEDIHRKLEDLSLLNKKYTDRHVQDFLNLIIQFKNVLEKGDYAI